MNCPICGSNKFRYQFTIRNLIISRCEDCNLLFGSCSEDKQEQRENYLKNEPYFSQPAIGDDEIEQIAIDSYLNELSKKGISKGQSLFIAAPDQHPIFEAAIKRGYRIFSKDELKNCNEELDAALLFFELEKSEDPAAFLNRVHQRLKPDGLLAVITPSLDSTSAKFFRSQWTEWREENRFYYNNTNIQLQMWKCGFEHVRVIKDRRRYSLDHIYKRAKAFPKSILTRFIASSYPLIPHFLRKIKFRLPTSGIVIFARKRKIAEPMLSIILPVYNENKTFPLVMEELLKKNVLGMKKEIIIIESNSKDGSRESVLAYKDNPEVKIVLQDGPHGKGNAVREGFKYAEGDVIVIQDADLEYDINDYDTLVEPVKSYCVPFVLGSRHSGTWKMRNFSDQVGVANFLNFGHIIFTAIINVLYHQHMKDPFTMYKVFHRDCLSGLRFECNRFDFDHELVIKLVQKGYTPLEIPVNYQSRSFKQGKKVQVIRDPLTWLWVDIRLRFTPIFENEEK